MDMMRDVVFEATKQGSLSLAAMALQWRCNGAAMALPPIGRRMRMGLAMAIGHGDWP